MITLLYGCYHNGTGVIFLTLLKFKNFVKQKMCKCVSNVIVSPVTATLKCTRGTGVDTHGAEAGTAVTCDEDGKARKITQEEASEKIGVSYRQTDELEERSMTKGRGPWFVRTGADQRTVVF